MSPDLETKIRQWCAESEGWTTAERCLEMAELVLQTKPTVVVEIGVFGGRSFIPQALALKQIGHGKIYGIDPWKKEHSVEGENDANKQWWMSIDIHMIHKLAVEAVWKYQVEEHAVVIRSASQFCADCIPPIDILYCDGNHSEVASCRDINLFLPKLKSGGFLWMDDTGWPTTQAAQRIAEKSCDLIFEKEDTTKYKLYKKSR